MAEYELVRRKSDGLYFNGSDFAANRLQAFVFYEGCACNTSDFLTEEYEFVPLDRLETAAFEKANSHDKCGCCGEWRSEADDTCPNTADGQHSWDFAHEE